MSLTILPLSESMIPIEKELPYQKIVVSLETSVRSCHIDCTTSLEHVGALQQASLAKQSLTLYNNNRSSQSTLTEIASMEGSSQKLPRLIAQQAGSLCSCCHPRSGRCATLVIQMRSCPLNNNYEEMRWSHSISEWRVACLPRLGHHSDQSSNTMERHAPILGSTHQHRATSCVKHSM